MILSIGYQCIAQAQLVQLAQDFNAVVLDVRGKPVSRKAGFGHRQLQTALGSRYVWAGETLGNYAGYEVTEAGLDALEAGERAGRNVILMCAEDAPGECHRHQLIAVPLLERGIDVRHVMDSEVYLASDLQRAIDSDDEDDEPESVSLSSILPARDAVQTA
jgi:uncharacterized protein (DUF488 family)